MGRLTSGVPDGSRILLGSVSIFYYIERNPRYFAAASEWMERVNAGRLTAAASALLLAEVLVPAYRAGNPAAALERIPNFELLEVTAAVSDVAARLRAEHNLRTPDALHVATALTDGASGW